MTERGLDGQAIRRAGSWELSEALRASRRDTLATFSVYEAALAASGLTVPERSDLNPPLWELGHIGWFQEFWLVRNPQRARVGRRPVVVLFRLALLHEDMHHEAALYMAQALGIRIDDPRWQPSTDATERVLLEFDSRTWQLGSDGGFAFDNELGAHEVSVLPYEIDSGAVIWDEFLSFVEAGGYAEPRWWSESGRRWLAAANPVAALPPARRR